MNIGAIVRSVRRTRGLSQQELSERSGVAGSALSEIEGGKRAPTTDTVNRLLRPLGHSLIAVPTLRDGAAAIAALIAEAVRDDRPRDAARHFIQLNDNLMSVHGAVRSALTVTEPAKTGLKHWDAAIAAVVALRLGEEGLPLPDWASSTDRRLLRAWTFTSGRYTIPVDRDQVPAEFLERGVLIDAQTLVSV